jgi:hypothetical protein
VNLDATVSTLLAGWARSGARESRTRPALPTSGRDVLGTVFVLGPVFAHRARGRGVLAVAWLLVAVPIGAVVFGFGLLTVLGHGGCFE